MFDSFEKLKSEEVSLHSSLSQSGSLTAVLMASKLYQQTRVHDVVIAYNQIALNKNLKTFIFKNEKI